MKEALRKERNKKDRHQKGSRIPQGSGRKEHHIEGGGKEGIGSSNRASLENLYPLKIRRTQALVDESGKPISVQKPIKIEIKTAKLSKAEAGVYKDIIDAAKSAPSGRKGDGFWTQHRTMLNHVCFPTDCPTTLLLPPSEDSSASKQREENQTDHSEDQMEVGAVVQPEPSSSCTQEDDMQVDNQQPPASEASNVPEDDSTGPWGQASKVDKSTWIPCEVPKAWIPESPAEDPYPWRKLMSLCHLLSELVTDKDRKGRSLLYGVVQHPSTVGGWHQYEEFRKSPQSDEGVKHGGTSLSRQWHHSFRGCGLLACKQCWRNLAWMFSLDPGDELWAA
ncbi:hypothetical protein BT69DRAFT_1291729 [Atractiella rhizophila]|nr:hypothetical protein BT69DRAFT_1291729 [Atractiella rhizophila]